MTWSIKSSTHFPKGIGGPAKCTGQQRFIAKLHVSYSGNRLFFHMTFEEMRPAIKGPVRHQTQSYASYVKHLESVTGAKDICIDRRAWSVNHFFNKNLIDQSLAFRCNLTTA